MKIIKTIALLLIILISNSAISQRNTIDDFYQVVRGMTALNKIDEGIHGSPYITNQFKKAQFVNSNKDFLMRFDAFRNLMEVKVNDSIFVLPKNLSYAIKFKASKKTYKIFQYNESEAVIAGLFVVINEMDGKSLLLKEKIEIEPEKIPRNGFELYKPPTLKRVKDQLFVGYKNNIASELPNKKEEIIQLFGSKAQLVEKQAKKMKWSFKKKDDLIKIFEYYYSLN